MFCDRSGKSTRSTLFLQNPLALLAYTKICVSKMPKKRSDAQNLHIKTLAASRMPLIALSNLPSPPVKTRHQVQQKRQEDRVIQQRNNINDLSSKLNDAEIQIAATNLENRQKDTLIREMQFEIQTHKDNALAFDVRSLEYNTLLENTAGNLRKARKRINRITNEHQLTKLRLNSKIRQLTVDKNELSEEYLGCRGTLASFEAATQGLQATVRNLETRLTDERNTNENLRKKAHRLDMQRRRYQAPLQKTRAALKSKGYWSPMEGNAYSGQARLLMRELLKAGCSSERVGDAMFACAQAFGIRVKNKVSARTVLRARNEGGYFGLMQLGREIAQSSGPTLSHLVVLTTHTFIFRVWRE